MALSPARFMGGGSQVQLVSVDDYKKQPRIHRKPKETFHLKYKPYEIVPTFIHPVLPGESLDSAFLQSRCVTDKVQSQTIGWWHEKHVFYVPLRALTDSRYVDTNMDFTEDEFNTFFLTNTTVAAAASGTALMLTGDSTRYYGFNGGCGWMYALYRYIVRTWFRDEDDLTLADLDQYPGAYIDELRQSWANSLKLESVGTEDPDLPGEDEMSDLDVLTGFTTIKQQYDLMVSEGLTDLSYRDYLKSYGITPPADVHVDPVDNMTPIVDPERLRVIRKWSYPTLAPQQGDASVSSVLYWSLAERITKTRFFAEPGFIIGITIVKPKLYLGNQKGSATNLLYSTLRWLPATLAHLPYTSVTEELDSVTAGIIRTPGEDYWLDIKDLFKYGGQWVNFAAAAGKDHFLAIPDATLTKIPTEAMIDSIFSVTDGTASYCYEDGACHFDILGKIRDTTPR